ncbi:ATP-binding protein [Candidatus Amarolinea dominans]|uniref:ATP-binding protein n=1 Tax=Candidatus Amarolinea dominans TaxID=3140696 RepID=UPI003136B30C|nr:ATP-binding protein [Anaerolineae bacterium]MBK9095322.1 ATP-binding protein [Anaerolineae bacterium]
MIARTLTAKIIALAQKFQVITLTGPRQSGKTTLVRAAFPAMPYASLEEPDMRQIALTDPRGFLANYPAGAILDEIQHTPDLLSYIQGLVDGNRQIQFILTGSSNFLLMEKISQTLAGRTAVLHLLPFSLAELKPDAERLESVIFQGQYPRIYDRDMAPTDFYPAYIQTYIERDVRLLKNIGDYNAFIQFTRLCAGRVGQLLNYASLASDAGISPNTARSWLSILESSFILYRLLPYYRNFNKRLVKSSKLYFYDTGVACSLLGIRDADQINLHYLKGALFENLVINEFIKRSFHRGENRQPFFWQDSHGKEIDCLLVDGEEITPVEIKAGKTMSISYFDNLKYWRALADLPEDQGFVVYGGDQSMQTSTGAFISWRHLDRIPS